MKKIFLILIALYLIVGVSFATIDLVEAHRYHNSYSLKNYLGTTLFGPGWIIYAYFTGYVQTD